MNFLLFSAMGGGARALWQGDFRSSWSLGQTWDRLSVNNHIPVGPGDLV